MFAAFGWDMLQEADFHVNFSYNFILLVHSLSPKLKRQFLKIILSVTCVNQIIVGGNKMEKCRRKRIAGLRYSRTHSLNRVKCKKVKSLTMAKKKDGSNFRRQ